MHLTTLGRGARISMNEVQQSFFFKIQSLIQKLQRKWNFHNIVLMTEAAEKLKKVIQETCYFSGKFLILVTQDYLGSKHLLKLVLYQLGKFSVL